MAKTNTPSIRMGQGDEPSIEAIGSYQFLLVDGSFTNPELTFSSFAELERWSDSLAHTVAVRKAVMREAAADDDAYDLAVGL